jgi:hypothetical protein
MRARREAARASALDAAFRALAPGPHSPAGTFSRVAGEGTRGTVLPLHERALTYAPAASPARCASVAAASTAPSAVSTTP